MRRFFQPTGPGSDGSIVLDGDEAHHAAQVIRLRSGERAVVLDGRGGEYHCTVQTISRREVKLHVDEAMRHAPPACRVRLVPAITKGKSFELILQKAVELGAAEVLPLLSEHVVARPEARELSDKQTRWQQVAVEAMKQCGTPWLPGIHLPAGVTEALEWDRPTELKLLAVLDAGARHPRRVLGDFRVRHGRSPESVSIWIGPEGDFTTAELERMIQAGTAPVTLGCRVLRSETAAMYALSVLAYELSAPG